MAIQLRKVGQERLCKNRSHFKNVTERRNGPTEGPMEQQTRQGVELRVRN